MSVREEIIITAFSLFSKHGCNSVGIDTIAGKSGVSRQTVYNHFESRDELVLEVMRWQGQHWRFAFRQMIEQRGGAEPLSQVRCIAPIIRERLEQPDFKGCFFMSAAAEFPNPNDAAHKTAQENLNANRSMIEDLATSAGLVDPQLFAKNLAMVIQGAIITKVIQQASDSGEHLCDLANILIERHLSSDDHC